MAAITLAHVGKRFDATDVIRDVSLDIADGEFCVLVGPSGSGKSTLLRLIAGLESATAGEVHIGGRDVTHHAPKDRDIAMVFQSYALYPQMTVRENMGFGLKLLKTPKPEIQRRVDEAARMLSLEALMERRPAALSGGQRQRVAMGRAMVRQPAAFLFDEPLSNLDAALRANVRAEIRTMHQRSKTTSVYVTHDQVEAMTMGDRIVVLRAGRVEQVGTPLALYNQPANRFVAGFIGSPAMNFFELDVVGAGTGTSAGAHLLLGSGQLPVPAAVAAALAKGGQPRVAVGMRPEHVHLLAESANPGGPEAAGLTLLTGVVKEIEFTGAQSQISLETAAGPLLACAAQRPDLKAGDSAQLTVAPQHLHYFDISTGQRLNAQDAAA